jgi:chromosome partitioning protein
LFALVSLFVSLITNLLTNLSPCIDLCNQFLKKYCFYLAFILQLDCSKIKACYNRSMQQSCSSKRGLRVTTIIAFISQKGGVGKSTLSRALGREAASGGLSVKIADLDTQHGTSVDWQRRRLAAGIEPMIQVEAFGSARQALERAGDFDLLILDGPARTSKATLEIARMADLVVQPTGASLDDLTPAVREYHALVNAGVPKSKLVFALNKIGTDSEERDARDYLTEAGYAVLAGAVFEKPTYRQAQNGGYALTETRHASLNRKADAVLQDLINRIGE